MSEFGDTPDDLCAQGLLQEGKTKRIWGTANPDIVIIENTDRLTAYNGREEIYIGTKGQFSTRISNVCFGYLRSRGVWNHYLWPASKVEDSHKFWAWKLDMLPVEFVVRFQPYGSYLARHPDRDYKKPFSRPILECFEKNDALGDPWLVPNRKKGTMCWYMPDQPRSKRTLIDERPLSEVSYLRTDRWAEAYSRVRDAAQMLRKSWKRGNATLVDIKFECGVSSVGDVVIGDIIDADCWRLWCNGDPNDPLDRQLFKNNCERHEILEAYETILNQTTQWLSLGGGNTGN